LGEAANNTQASSLFGRHFFRGEHRPPNGELSCDPRSPLLLHEGDEFGQIPVIALQFKPEATTQPKVVF
jgi:hypothetical protein